ncbi:toxin [Pseudomonas sp. PDM32]|nr:toxin [Pseudomonas sp. PDM32]
MHRYTPSLTANDPRGLVVRAVGYWRDNDGVLPQTRVNRTVHDWAGRAIAQWDPRLFLDASAAPNLQTIHALSGAVLCTDSVDAGLRVALLGEAGQPVHHWDGRGSQRWMQYDIQLRPVSVFEQPLDGEALCTERLSYGASDPAAAERNQCGQLIRHDDPAGSQRYTEFGLHGTALEQTRHFLNDLALPDWPESIVDREWLLEPGEGATTRSQVNALGEVSHQTDAKGHRQLFSQTLDGQLLEVRLQLNGTPTPKTLVSAITYNAHGQTEREVAGNGVITTLEYDAQNGRLTRISAQRGNEALQDLNHAYDPVGNVLSIKDAALPIRYFANQRIEPTSHYCYDSFSQLIEATGWEAGGSNKGPQFATFDDPAACANFRQTYHYDLGGNLLELTHEGPQSHGHRLVAAAHSNRCLPVLEGVEPGEDDFRRGFDGNGNLLKLQPGQALAWDLRNQLVEVRPVVRDSGVNDRERYVYGADGMRLRKVRETLAHARTLVAETRYLPNLELRSHSGTGEVLQVVNVQAGRCSVRVLHWESAPPKGSANDRYRYHLNDHLGSCALELDEDGEVISQERYHPFGTTAWFAGRGEVEASYRTVRYSGKERDATGLYYYGFRYYVPWWQRWLNPDPAGIIDGSNFFSMVSNTPLNLKDSMGLAGDDPAEGEYFKQRGIQVLRRGAKEIGKVYPKIEEHIYQGVDDSLEMLATASQKLKNPETVGSILRDYFGETPESVINLHETAEAVIERINKISQGIAHHQKTKGQDIVMVGFSKNGPIYTFQDDPKIYLTSQVNDRANGAAFARIFIHETSHSVAATQDIWSYKNQRKASVGMKSDQDLERQEAAIIALNPLAAGARLDIGLFIGAIDGLDAVSAIEAQGVEPVLRSVLQKYQADASLRVKVNLLNASTVESLIHALNVDEVNNKHFPW